MSELGKSAQSDSFLYRLKKLARRDALNMLQKMNREVLTRAKARGAFRRKAVAAVDLTYIPYYGRPNRYVVQGEYKLGTNRFHCYAAFRLVKMGRRYVVKSRLVTPLELCDKTGIVEEFVEEVRRQGVRIRLLLLDKGLYSGEVVETLKALRVKFLIAVPKNRRVKEVIMGYYRTGRGG